MSRTCTSILCRSWLFLAVVLVGSLALKPGQAASLDTLLPGAELRGKATFRYLGFALYQARLFTPAGKKLDWKQDFALKLTYKRRLSEKGLVEATLHEMKRTGPVPAIRDELQVCFDEVGPGDSYVAVTNGSDRIGFWLNGTPSCTLSYPNVAYRFMAIFLGEESRSPDFSRRLRGE